ncbi:MAG TPA: hypothetical protein VIK14_08365 [Ignavibacteria bacterium]
MKFKLFILIINVFYFLIIHIVNGQIDKHEKVILKINPYQLKSYTDYKSLEVTIENISVDTLITINDPFSLYGLYLDRFNNIGSISTHYRPNEISFFEIGSISQNEGRGEYALRFQTIPKISLIKPFSVLIVNVLLSEEIKKFILPYNWDLYCHIRFIEKNKIDSIIYNNYSELVNEYNNSLVYNDTVNLYGINKDSLFIKFNRRDDEYFRNMSHIDSVLDYFNKRAIFLRD